MGNNGNARKLTAEEYDKLVRQIAERVWKMIRRDLANQQDRRPRSVGRR